MIFTIYREMLRCLIIVRGLKLVHSHSRITKIDVYTTGKLVFTCTVQCSLVNEALFS